MSAAAFPPERIEALVPMQRAGTPRRGRARRGVPRVGRRIVRLGPGASAVDGAMY